MYSLIISKKAILTIDKLKTSPRLEKRYKAVSKALIHLAHNPRHTGLQTHEYSTLRGPKGQKVFEAYAEQNTPGAYRVFFYYGDLKSEIVIMAITPHP